MRIQRQSVEVIVVTIDYHTLIIGCHSLQVALGQGGGGSFKSETLIAFRAEPRLCLQVKPPVHRSNKLLTFNLMPCLSNVESFLISSVLIASQLLLEDAHCIPLSPQSVPSHLISTHLMSSEFFTSSQLFAAHVIMSSYLSLFDVISFSSKSICSLVVFHCCSSHVNTSHLPSVVLAFVQDFPHKVKAEDVKTKLSYETSFMRDFLQISKVQVVKMTPELAVPTRGRSENDPGTNERVPKPSAGQASPSIFQDRFCPAKHSISCILSKTYFARDFPQKVKVEDVKTKLSCETSVKI